MSISTYLQRSAEAFEADALAEFISTFKASLDFRLWVSLQIEEAKEVVQAFSEETPEQQLKELADFRYVCVGAAIVRSQYIDYLIGAEDVVYTTYLEIEELMKPIIELYDDRFTVGQMEEAFARVHASNLSKLDDDGNPIFREDGKILKGPNYKAPDMTGIYKEAA